MTFKEYLLKKYPLWTNKNLNDFHVKVGQLLEDYEEYILYTQSERDIQDIRKDISGEGDE